MQLQYIKYSKGHGCSLVVIRESAQQVMVAAILVCEACIAWHAADWITTPQAQIVIYESSGG